MLAAVLAALSLSGATPCERHSRKTPRFSLATRRPKENSLGVSSRPKSPHLGLAAEGRATSRREERWRQEWERNMRAAETAWAGRARARRSESLPETVSEELESPAAPTLPAVIPRSP